MPVKPERRYSSVPEFRIDDERQYIVRGYASTFDPYLLYEDISERIEPTAFDDADMSDIIMQYDHEGRVFARQSNGTLKVGVDEHGLWMEADLSKTDGARSLYEDIKSGMITEMSFAFTVSEDHFEKNTRTRIVDKIKKVYDVSAVSIPANPNTEISARSYYDGVIEQEKQERLLAEETERKVRLLKLLLEVN